MYRNLWAENQASTYFEAATRLRDAASRQHDASIARNLNEIAARYEALGKTIEAFSVRSHAA